MGPDEHQETDRDEIKEMIQCYERMVSDRYNLDDMCQEIAERVLPRQSELFLNSGGISKYERKTERMYDPTAAVALERFAAVMESMLTPMHQVWHRLRSTNEDLNREHEVQVYFDQINKVLWDERKRYTANYQSQQFETYMSLGAFGTGINFIDANDIGGLRYRAVHLSELYFDMNFQGIVDTAYRCIKMTPRHIKQRVDAGRFNELPKDIERWLSEKDKKEVDVLHVVKPRSDYDVTRNDQQNRPFASFYILKEKQYLLSEGGFDSFPYAVSRYVVAPGEVYGRSPAMTALPAINTLNEQKKTLLKQGHRSVDPIILAHDDGVLDNLSLKPGAINFGGVSKEGRPLVTTLPVGNPMIGPELMEMEKQVIHDVFLTSIFQILIERRGQTPPTATEVLELAKEKGSLLSPTMGRQQSEALGPQITRELDLLSMQGMLPELPPVMMEAEAEYEIEYESPLSRAQRAEEASGLFRSIEFATAHANVTQDPSAFDWIDIDKAMPAVMEINGVPAAWRRSMDAVMQMREGRNQQAATQQMIEAAPAAAGILKAVQR